MRLSRISKLAMGLTCAGLILAACSSSPSSSSSSGIPSGGTKVSGGTATFAEPPGATPNYIFPFETSQYDTVNNVSQFQYLMYRPLYMFGSPQSQSTTLDSSLSLADVPSFSGTTATVTMKNYMWSNGEPVSAADVMFFLNMIHAQKANWYSYVPGLFPDNVKNAVMNSSTQLTLTLDKTYAANWFTYNELSQVTPFPTAWDITAVGGSPGSGKCSSGTFGAASTDAACTAVYNFLTKQAQADPSTIAASPIWSVVDGPWKLSSFDSSGDVTMVPNSSYSGPVKPSVSQFKEVPFTTDTAEFNALVAGQVDVGYLPPQNVTQPTSNAVTAGPNNSRLSANYYLNPWVLFGYNYLVLKLTSVQDNGAAGPIFSQAYFRQAMQSLIDQTAMISRILKGYAVPTYGPVPVLPDNPYVDSFEKSNPYPYNPSKAKSLLTSHGWKVVAGGTDTCIKPGTASDECGANIPAGAALNFTFVQASGTQWQTQVANIETSAWKSVGINVSLQQQTFDTVVSNYAPPCSSPCNLEMGWWGGGWVYAPDFLPTGEVLFATGAANGSSNWSDPKTDQLIAQTNTTNVSLSQYEDYMATILPGVLWQPNADYQLTEIKNNLRGAAPQNPFSTIFPENYFFVS